MVAQHFATWGEAYVAAVLLARAVKHDVGIFREKQLTNDGFTVRPLPPRGSGQGDELTCAIVKPTHSL
jgi:hypothetical protein